MADDRPPQIPGARISAAGKVTARGVRNVDISPMARLAVATSLALAVGSIVGNDVGFTSTLQRGLLFGFLAGFGVFGLIWLAFRSVRTTRWLNRLADSFTPHDTTRKWLRRTSRRLRAKT